MEHTMETVENICNTVKSLDNAMDFITEVGDEHQKVKEGIRAAREYILSAVNADTRFSQMCKLFTEALDRDLTYIDISDMDLWLSDDEIVDLLREFGVSRFTMSMSNTNTIRYASIFWGIGFSLECMCKLEDGKFAIVFGRN